MRLTDRPFVYPHLKSWQKAVEICTELSQRGFVAYFAGGCVRDWCLGRSPKDFDVATDAKPDQVAEIFPGSQLVGKAFGVVLVGGVEVATFRKDGPYSDGRHPDRVEFCTAKEDALRRDFTINALFYDLKSGQVIDHVGGLEDLKRALIRTVGDPEQRFSEDLLRPLRALRFLAQLEDFSLDPLTLQAITRTAPRASSVAKERLWQEWEKILLASKGPRVRSLKLFKETGWWAQVFPGWFEDLDSLGLWDRLWQRHLSFCFASGLEAADQVAVLMSLSHYDQMLCRWHRAPEGKCEAAQKFVRTEIKQALRAAKLSGRMQEAVVFLLLSLLGFLGLCPLCKADGIRALAEPRGHLLPALVDSLSERAEQKLALEQLLSSYSKICDRQGRLPEPFVGGEFLLKQGLKAGPLMGEILLELYNLQLEGEISSLRQAEDLALELISKSGPVGR